MIQDRVSPADIEQSLRSLIGGVTETAQASEPVLARLAVVGAIAVVILAYGLGRRRGKAKSALIEIRRL
jgi:hypothetical protein